MKETKNGLLQKCRRLFLIRRDYTHGNALKRKTQYAIFNLE